jgi:initiation factor 1A
MPNKTGGKNYKKKKKVGAESEVAVNIERQEDQQIARVIKVLGNCNFQCFCNDNFIRICHIRGGLRGVWMNVGDIVLISLRGDTCDVKGKERGDILAKYDPRLLNKLKKEPDVNQKLFLQLENSDGDVLEKIKTQHDAEGDGIEFDLTPEGEQAAEDSSELEIDKI